MPLHRVVDRYFALAPLFVAGALVCSGCAGFTPRTTLEEESLAEVQSFVDAITRHYKVPPIRAGVRERGGAWVQSHVVHVSHEVLTAALPFRDAAVARLVGFLIIETPTPLSEAHEELINQKAYPQANAAAVDILVSVKGLPEQVAVELVHDLLLAQVDAVAEERMMMPLRTPNPCEQAEAFRRLFARYRLAGSASCP